MTLVNTGPSIGRYEVTCLRCDKHLNIHKWDEVHPEEEVMYVMVKDRDHRVRFYLCKECRQWFHQEFGI